MVNSVKELFHVHVNYIAVSFLNIGLSLFDCIVCSFTRSKAIATRRKIWGEYWSHSCSRACWMSRSITVGIPNKRTPPPGLGISTRMTGADLKVPVRSSVLTVSQRSQGELVILLPSLRRCRGLLRFVLLAGTQAEDYSGLTFYPAIRLGLRKMSCLLVPTMSSALRHTLAASPLLFVVSLHTEVGCFRCSSCERIGSSLL